MIRLHSQMLMRSRSEEFYHRVSSRDSCKAESCYCMPPQLCPSIRSSQEFVEKNCDSVGAACVRVWHTLRLHGHDATAQGIADQVGLGAQAELLHKMGAVCFYCAGADPQGGRDLSICPALGGQVQNLAFTRGQRLIWVHHICGSSLTL